MQSYKPDINIIRNYGRKIADKNNILFGEFRNGCVAGRSNIQILYIQGVVERWGCRECLVKI